MIEFFALIGVSIILFSKSLVIPGIILVLLACHFAKRRKRGRTCRPQGGGDNLAFQAARDNGVSPPRNPRRQRLLREFYDLYLESRENYPSLREHYDGIIQEMWQALKRAKDPKEWEDIIERLKDQWPQPQQRSHVWEKLKEAKLAASHLQQSMEEVARRRT